MLLGAIDVLPQLFQTVHTPPEVMRELQHPRAPESVRRWAESPPDWLQISTPKNSTAFNEDLDPGEAHAIALAVELNAAAVLIDEK